MVAPWRLAKSLVALRQQVNTLAPKRSTKSDGAVGDERHAERQSDHNPNARRVVCAIDITHDPKGGLDSYALAEKLRQSRDQRIHYVVSNRRIFYGWRGRQPWKWLSYSGSNPHSKHVHISVVQDPVKYDDPKVWTL